MRALTGIAATVFAAWSMSACSPCFATLWCEGFPEVGYTGQMIQQHSGLGVAGVTIRYAQTSGNHLDQDTVTVVSDAGGFFTLRATAVYEGVTYGNLSVTPPAPWAPYVVPNFGVRTSRVRGDGGVVGRLVVDPYMLLVGQVRNRYNNDIAEGARVSMRRVSGAVITPDSSEHVTDLNGYFFTQPQFDGFNDALIAFDYTLDGWPRMYHVTMRLRPNYADGRLTLITLKLGGALQYVAEVHRRGSNAHLAGTTVQFQRTGGIAVDGGLSVITPNTDGSFAFSMRPLDSGHVTGDLVMQPPAPLATEAIKNLTLYSHDDDSTRLLGLFGYGAQAHFTGRMEYRATGLPVEAGRLVVVRRTAGLAVALSPGDTGVRVLDTLGRLAYAAATADSGNISFSVEAGLQSPHAPETLSGFAMKARYADDPTDIGVLKVGLWHPSFGIAEDFDTGLPVAGAMIEFVRTSGAAVAGALYQATSAADGKFPVRPVPLGAGTTIGTLTIKGGPVYRDTTITGVQLLATQNDTLRSLGVFRLRHAP